MYTYILMEELVANALFVLIKKQETNEVELTKLVDYGNAIVHKLGKAILLVSKYYTNDVIYNYSDYFELTNKNGKEIFKLKDEKTVDDLNNKFRAFMPLKTLEAFMDPVAIEVLVA